MGLSLLVNLRHGSAGPYLRLAEAKKVGNGGSGVVLHHAFGYLGAFTNALACNDEWCFHLLHCDSAVTFVDSAVVGSDDDDCFVVYPGFFRRFDNAANKAVEALKHRVISGGIMSGGMSGVVRLVEADGE